MYYDLCMYINNIKTPHFYIILGDVSRCCREFDGPHYQACGPSATREDRPTSHGELSNEGETRSPSGAEWWDWMRKHQHNNKTT